MRNNSNNISYFDAFLIAISSVLLLIESNSSIIATIIIGASLRLALNPVTLIPLIFVSSVSSSITAIPGLAGIFYYLYLFLAACCCKNKFILPKSKAVYFLIIYAIWIVISSLQSVTGETSQAYRILVAIFAIILGSMFKLDHKQVINYLLIMAIACSIYIIYKISYEPILFLPGEGAVESYSANSNIQLTIAKNINPNTLAQFLLIIYLIIFNYALELKKQISFICILPILPILIIGSRTIFISLIAISMIQFILTSKVSKKTKLLTIFLGSIFSSFLMNIAISTNERLAIETIAENKGSGRFDTWNELFNHVIPNNLFCGVGYGANNLSKLGYYLDGDNLYVDILTQLGIIGFILFFTFVLILFINLKKGNSTANKIAISFILFIFWGGMGETIFDTFIFWAIAFYSLSIITNNQIHKIIIPNDKNRTIKFF